jgi:AcrR family transcriptional regulator
VRTILSAFLEHRQWACGDVPRKCLIYRSVPVFQGASARGKSPIRAADVGGGVAFRTIAHMNREPRKKQRIRNPVQTRARLLQATVDLVADKGAEALSLKEAARRANLSRAVAYQHFKDRDHLLSEAKNWIAARLADAIKQVGAAPIEERTRDAARLVLQNREAAKLLIADALAGRDLGANHPLYKLVRKTLKEFVASGAGRGDIDLEVLTYIMLGTSATILMLGEALKSVGSDSLADRFAAEWSRILTSGIFVTDAQRKARTRLRSRKSRNRAAPRSGT